jgi:hypothetical protein
MLDSLVRVSRRVNENHFVKIAKHSNGEPQTVPRVANSTALLSKLANAAGPGTNPNEGEAYLFLSLTHRIN